MTQALCIVHQPTCFQNVSIGSWKTHVGRTLLLMVTNSNSYRIKDGK